MNRTITVSGPNLFRVHDGGIDGPANSGNSTTTQSAAGAPAGGSTYLACEIAVRDPGDNDHAWGGVESAWAFLADSPGPSPLRVGLQLGPVLMRASGARNNELGWSSHETYATLSAFARVLHPEARDLRPLTASSALISFWNIDLGPQNAAKMWRLTTHGPEIVGLNQDRWDSTLVTFTPTMEFDYAPVEPVARGELVAFVVGFRLTVSAPEVNDYDFRLSAESSASIAWVNLQSGAA